MSDARVCATMMGLLLGFGWCACGSDVATPKLEVTTPSTHPPHATQTVDLPRMAPSEQMVELPRSNPGGQSGSIGSTVPFCTAGERRQVTARDETLHGYTLDALHAELRDRFAKPLALSWYVGPRVATRVTLSFDLPSEATLVQHHSGDPAVTDETPCAQKDLVEERGTLRIRTSDGLLDAEVTTDIVLGPLAAAGGPGVTLHHLIALNELGAPLRAAIADALAAVRATESYSGIRVELMRSDRDDTGWELRVLLMRAVGEDGALVIARAWHDWALPAERVGFTPRAELAAACERSVPPASGLAPDSDAMPFNSIAGTWLLCSGTYPASVRAPDEGLRVAPDGGFVMLGFEAGELVEQPGFGRQGQLWPSEPSRYEEFVAGSNLMSAPGVPTFVPVRVVGELLFRDNSEYGGLRGLRGQLEPGSDGHTLRAGPIDTWLDPPDLRYVRTDLPVRRATASPWSAGEAAGMAGCAAQDSGRRLALPTDATRITGSFSLCGELRGAARLVLESDARFRALDEHGAPVWQGRYEVRTDPLLVHSSDSRADLVLTDDAGTRDVLGLVAVSERPFKLLMWAFRPDDLAWAPDRFAVLSPEP